MEGFNDRVGKVFDCLSSSSSSSNKPWSLSDAEIERKTWNRDKTKSDDDDTILVSSSFNNLMKSINNKSEKNKKRNHNSLDDPSDDDDAVEDDEDLDVRSSVGLDPTLDFEDEEDEYDKIAAGTEDTDAHLLYMKDVTNHAPFLNSHHILSKKHVHDNADANDDNDDDDKPLVNDAVKVKVKSILKRKSKELEKPSAKRVRFDPNCKERDAPEVDVDGFVGVQVAKSQRSGVPDYLLNPSKYTRYTFNDDDDKRTNTEAYLDFIEQIRKSKDVGSEEEKQPAAELPASVVFVPRKKRGDAAPSNSEGDVKDSSTGVGISIAAVEVQQDEVSDMIQDVPDVDAVSAEPPKFQKPSRQYRSKIEDEDTVC